MLQKRFRFSSVRLLQRYCGITFDNSMRARGWSWSGSAEDSTLFIFDFPDVKLRVCRIVSAFYTFNQFRFPTCLLCCDQLTLTCNISSITNPFQRGLAHAQLVNTWKSFYYVALLDPHFECEWMPFCIA
ncbi:unnamed protein product [Albugo candida]|uniref:Uncharacterized protein n=1 Tax=Albugo candida TaxID=65357 RepID=A0A024FV70_9STRA|nr:unnamed protein product [Albugo candida]|eukprot:CCI10941.1 unnamed protein product [Albugo candida]